MKRNPKTFQVGRVGTLLIDFSFGSGFSFYQHTGLHNSPSSPFTDRAFLALLQQKGLTSRDEEEMLRAPCDVVRVQRGKPPEVMDRTATFLKAHGYEEESKLLSGKQTLYSPFVDIQNIQTKY